MATQTTIQESRPPAYLQPYYEKLAQGAQGISQQPYIGYGGQRVAGLTGMENAAHQGIAQMAMSGHPQAFQQAQQYGGNMLGLASQAPGMGYQDLRGMAQGIGAVPQWPGANHQAYMNPYMQNVTNIASREAANAGRRQMQELGSGMAMSGAFGGDRHALLQGDILQNTRQQVADITQAGQAQAYGQGIGAFQADRDAWLRGQGMSADVMGRANQLYQSGLGMYNQGIGTMAGLGGQSQAMLMDRLGALQGAGAQQRAVQQAGMDVGFQDYMRQQNYGMDRMNFLAGILGGSPYTSQFSNQTTNLTQDPSLFNTMIGGGIGGLAMARSAG